MVASALYILDARGKTIISRDFRGDVPDSAANAFKKIAIDVEDRSLVRPFNRLEKEGFSFVHIQHEDLYLVAVTRKNSNVAVLISFLYKLVDVLTRYFKVVNEDSVKDNFVIIYELLDEMMDFGYPQVTEPRILKEYITQESHVKDYARPPAALTSAVSWRSEGILHPRNEVFLDVIEKVNILISGTGNVLRSEVHGSMMVKSYLSGMPDCKLGLNDKLQFDASGQRAAHAVELEDIKFHQCVRLNEFEQSRTITFIPPDGQFELMSYRLNTQVRPIIWVDAVIEQRVSRVDYLVKARAQLGQRFVARDVKITVPVLPDVSTPQFKLKSGRVKYVPANDTLVWHIRKFKPDTELTMRGWFSLPSVGKDEERDASTRRPITVEFEVPYLAVSGLQVRFLKVVEKSGYLALPWVRYVTQAGDYQIRLV
uniref:MHD domain-containing protein n=1 Tax=Erythrolobus australicus TaxID=1077150 RepID=A0A7S1XJW9_9RHOD|mmetsp:Transcript_762/g.2041  ORF Transcript_762/g.2041 Transcript_762/m.2041 type:complete len:426 (+) Transcript_762:124-1401(+)